jgi:nucleotide-binding universal stress UspA family protein
MTSFTHILVPTDFGEAADRALDFAIDIASKFDAKLTVFHVSGVPAFAYAFYAEGLSWPTNEMTKGATTELDTFLHGVKERYPKAEGVVVSGEPWLAILEAAKKQGADLIVMGTHGRRGISRVLLGSVAEKVVRLSPVPVLTISGKADQMAKEKALSTP